MALKLIREDYLQVSSLHKIYYAEYGRSDGIPILFIHGGPGSKSKVNHLDFLPDEVSFCAILFDQRGCGQSLPSGEVKENTTSDLIEDIEKLRRHLGIKRWYLTGGSWGSTLALLYAQAFPQKVEGLILRNIFLARRKDIKWLYSSLGAKQFFPDKAAFVESYLKKEGLEWSELIDYAYKKMLSGGEETKKQLIALISNWEYGLMNLDPPFHLTQPEEIEEEEIHSTTIYCHYATNDFFIQDNQILRNIKAIEKIPTAIIHGRYDMVCPPEQAYLLHQHLTNSKLIWVNYAGHHLGWSGYQWMRELIKGLVKEEESRKVE